uniref:SGNH hydrolase-type esterase domain-containing protein n=1 Tax=Leptocylindrus danicus TaxID=163516 RepID=A0A7S2L5P2_9STRA|mmetsp:Transcript_32102/g.46674  ORF Transcript_32102/g.46674 Transcript_32102/m.46674 type:complete len:261 (+) Transcript_32102:320-1102(+)|eukprot:CAMPEP_0116033920 /NCGR_PEP_ID=MMETSP0321-20121206/19284_1 /TAXON_ID=163516 /ORGANISM="Leptocylindrus danicus var. danicus, Strain B650" /LENGTH=260 /DNA_ID=CAMNT_0003510103 /DNA_START=125 /DNA_END=907 /DNA_ORIENTATION=-
MMMAQVTTTRILTLLSLYSSLNNTRRTFTHAAAMSSTTTTKKIFCYGDSLTAGTTPTDLVLHPYAPHLETALNEMVVDANTNIQVRWKGLPGWTASNMLEYQNAPDIGLKTFLNKFASNDDSSSSQLDFVVILAGTNDIGQAFASQQQDKLNVEQTAQDIASSIIALHELAHEEGIPTLAIAIPPSGFQHAVSTANDLGDQTNAILEEWCSKKLMGFFEFPFGWSAGDERWAPDGLHLSEEGYRQVGAFLAPMVYMNGCM